MTSPGVVCSMRAAVESLTGPGDRIVIQTPVYRPFYDAVLDSGRTLIANPLIRDPGGYYRMDMKR